MARSYIALDTHCSSTDMAVVDVAGKLIQRQRCETNSEPRERKVSLWVNRTETETLGLERATPAWQ